MFNMLHCLSLVIVSIVIVHRTSCLQENYYWREYTGSIPADAIVGGKSVNNTNIYIGQAYYKNVGLIVVEIHPGMKKVRIPINGNIEKIKNHVKILCGSQRKFYWLSTSASQLHLTLFEKHAVIGGHIDGSGQINVGRINYQGKIKIGRILSYDIENAYLVFDEDGREKGNIESYEVLIYKSEIDLDPMKFYGVGGYYWKEYTGSIPNDAMIGGRDINGNEVYIGQAYHNIGLIPVQIYSGKQEVVIPVNLGIKKVDRFIKILCGFPANFYWLATNSSDLLSVLNHKNAVIGGHIDGYSNLNGLVNIGRISYQSETKIGRILTYYTDKYFYFDNHGEEGINVKSYEILMYDNKTVRYEN